MIVYISGKITNDFDYLKKFSKAEKRLKALGHIPLNPNVIPLGLSYNDYMTIDLAMVEVSDAILMLSGWETSKGASTEFKKALSLNKIILIEVPDSGSYVEVEVNDMNIIRDLLWTADSNLEQVCADVNKSSE